MKGIFIPDITVEMFRNGCLEAIEALMAEGEIYDIEYDLKSAQPEVIRCKDCRHGVDYYHEGDCYCSNPKWGLMYFGGSWEFYCGGAELRGGEK